MDHSGWRHPVATRCGCPAGTRWIALVPLVLGLAIPGAAGRLDPGSLDYLGAFRLPGTGGDTPASWDWGGQAMTYVPDGDPSGPDDGFPGSLVVTGTATENWVSEVSIPAPVRSADPGALPEATTLQPFADVRQGLFPAFVELPRVGLEYLPPRAGQTSGHLYLAWGQHYHEDPDLEVAPTHGRCEMDLTDPQTRGPWWVGTAAANREGFIYAVNDYLFAIPDGWAAEHTGGRALATGRFRDGGWSGMGPGLVAIGPWLDGDPPGTPPPPGTELTHVDLLRYSTVGSGDDHRLQGYSPADGWGGGAWLTADGDAAVVFVGTRASGYTWYGFFTPGGVGAPPLYPEGAPCPYMVGDLMCVQPDGETPCTEADLAPCAGAPVEEESRGWWASRFDAVLLFYDTSDLSAVAAGTMEPWEPQPYASLDVDSSLLLPDPPPDVAVYMGSGPQRQYRLGAAAFDRERGLLYVLEPFGHAYEPVVHVWRVRSGGPPVVTAPLPRRSRGRVLPER